MADLKETGLPADWEVRHSNSKNLPYYFNAVEKTSSWEPPSGTDTEKLKQHMAKYHSASSRPADNQSATTTTTTSSSTAAATNGTTTSSSQPGKIRAAHLLVKHEESRRPASWREAHITRTKSDAHALISSYERRIKSNNSADQISLGDLALTESDCVSARKHGDLGYFGKGDMQKEFEEAAFALDVGQVSGVVDTASGLHLIQRLD